jgi:glycopeptide antibiotics resistance protein
MPWRLDLVNFYIYGLHVEPYPPLADLDQAILNFFGPIIAIIPFALLLSYVKDRVPRVAIIGNIFVLVFFAVLESSYELLEFALEREIGILTSPEFNIGIAVLILLGVIYWKIWRARSEP